LDENVRWYQIVISDVDWSLRQAMPMKYQKRVPTP
jgi:hypothetical protein